MSPKIFVPERTECKKKGGGTNRGRDRTLELCYPQKILLLTEFFFKPRQVRHCCNFPHFFFKSFFLTAPLWKSSIFSNSLHLRVGRVHLPTILLFFRLSPLLIRTKMSIRERGGKPGSACPL